jgi:APA family basic amino acid/polyamine antiporter
MRHQLSAVSATFLVVASMLGTGILTTSGMILSLVKSPSAMISLWVVGGLLALFGAFCYGEIAKIIPRNGGEASILRELFSPTMGEIAGWTSFVVGFAASSAASSLALAAYLGEAAPELPVRAEIIACIALAAVAALHTVFGRYGMRIQTWLAIGKFLLLAGLAIYALFLAAPTTFAGALESGQPAADFGADWGVALMFVMFAYSGWNAATYVAGEIRNPARNVRNAMVIGTAITVVLYTAVNVAIIKQLPSSEIEHATPVVSVLVKSLFGNGAAVAFSALVAFALLSSLGASAFLGPRVLAAMLAWMRDGKQGAEAGNTAASSRLVWLQAGVSVAMVLTGTFAQILTVMGFLLGFFPILSVLTLYRSECVCGDRGNVLARYLFGPVFILTMGAILVLSAMERPLEVLVAASMVLAFFLLRQRMRRIAWSPS